MATGSMKTAPRATAKGPRHGWIAVSVLLAGAWPMTGEGEDMARTVTLDPAARYQVIEGWGTSLCWWATIVGGWQEAARTAIADHLFDPDRGLGLNIVRYNIGGGDAPDHHHMRPGGAVPGYRAAPDAEYDWTADANQRWILQAAVERGADRLEAFSNSPPWWMTVSGCSAGADDPNHENLREDAFDAFADYLVDVTEHFHRAWSITFDTLAPLNEPGANWWKAGKGQEGCRFAPPAQARILRAVAAALDRRNLPTRVSAMDAHAVSWAINHFQAYDPEAQGVISRLNAHAYRRDKRAELRNLAAGRGLGLWMSEFDMGSNNAGHDHAAMGPGIDLAHAIVGDLRELQPTGWVFWQAVENEQYCIWWKYNYGLIHGDLMHGTEAWHITKKYHVMGQFSRHLRPGCQRIGIDADDTVAFLDWDRRRAVVVAVNAAGAPRQRSYRTDGLGGADLTVAAYRTAAGEDQVRLEDIRSAEGRFEVSERETSVTTYVLTGIGDLGPLRDRGLLRLNDTMQGPGPNRFEFRGEWAFKGEEPAAFTRDNHWGWRPDDTYSIHFEGTGLVLHAARDPNHGIAGVSLDAGEEHPVDFYAPQRQDQAEVYRSPKLPEGRHRLVVRVTGDRNPAAGNGVIPADRADILRTP